MNKNTLRLTLASVAACSAITLGSATASAYDEHVIAAEDFISNAVVNDADITTNGCWINWPSTEFPNLEGHTKGTCYFTELMKGAFGYSTAEIKGLWGTPTQTTPPTIPTLTSRDFFNKINASICVDPTTSTCVNRTVPAAATETYFRWVTKISDVHSGDVISVDMITTTPTYPGHVMIVRGNPVQMTPLAPIYSMTLQWAVPITDSTTTAHGCAGQYKDERWSGGGAPAPCDSNATDFAAGAGRAYIRIYTDSLTGKILGYTWSATSNSPYYSPSTRPYRIGRLVNLPPAEVDEPPPPPPDFGSLL